jgi:hypothetical protein
MCRDVDENMRPVDATDYFNCLVPEIWCSVKVSHAPPDTKVKAQWIYISGESTHLHNFLFYETVATTEGTRYIGFRCPLTEVWWPTGHYEIVLYIDDEEELSVPFTVWR